jgi:DNA-binding FadR family transcriptional regulator
MGVSVAVNGTGALRALHRERLIDRAVDAIKEHILANSLKGGDRLPSESELARTLGVSRNVVRQAVSSLETLGIVRVAQGRGIYVAELADTDVFRQLASWVNTSELDDREYVEVHSIFERGVFELLIKNASDADFDDLGRLARSLQNAATPDEVQRLHDEFHHLCLTATGNRFLVTLGTILYRFFWSITASGPHVRHVSTDYLRSSHLGLVELLRRRRLEDVSTLVNLHLGLAENTSTGGLALKGQGRSGEAPVLAFQRQDSSKLGVED